MVQVLHLARSIQVVVEVVHLPLVLMPYLALMLAQVALEHNGTTEITTQGAVAVDTTKPRPSLLAVAVWVEMVA